MARTSPGAPSGAPTCIDEFLLELRPNCPRSWSMPRSFLRSEIDCRLTRWGRPASKQSVLDVSLLAVQQALVSLEIWFVVRNRNTSIVHHINEISMQIWSSRIVTVRGWSAFRRDACGVGARSSWSRSEVVLSAVGRARAESLRRRETLVRPSGVDKLLVESLLLLERRLGSPARASSPPTYRTA